MRWLMYPLVVTMVALVGGCSKASTSSADIVGIWQSVDGATIKLENTGQFVVTGLPGFPVLGRPHQDERLSGVGRWQLQEGTMGREIKLVFDRLGDRERVGVRILTSGKGTSLKLFIWEDEEGGARYEFEKK